MIVVFSVMSVLSTIAIASFVSYNKVQVLQTATSDLSSTLALAKSQALSQIKPTQCSNLILNGYQVVLNVANNSYHLDAVCSSVPCNSAIVMQTSTLPKNVSFDGVKTTSTCFFFPVIVNGVRGTGTIYLNAYGLPPKTVTVDGVGAIK